MWLYVYVYVFLHWVTRCIISACLSCRPSLIYIWTVFMIWQIYTFKETRYPLCVYMYMCMYFCTEWLGASCHRLSCRPSLIYIWTVFMIWQIYTFKETRYPLCDYMYMCMYFCTGWLGASCHHVSHAALNSLASGLYSWFDKSTPLRKPDIHCVSICICVCISALND